jgi:DNA repair protein RadC
MDCREIKRATCINIPPKDHGMTKMPVKPQEKKITYLREIEIKYTKRKVLTNSTIGKSIQGVKQVVELFSDLQNETKEKMLTLNLDTKNKILCFEVVAIGTTNQLLTRTMDVFRTAILVNAYSAIVVHNHPSGDPTPSKNDKKLTDDLAFLSKKMGLVFQDHIIIGEDCYYSFYEDGKL